MQQTGAQSGLADAEVKWVEGLYESFRNHVTDWEAEQSGRNLRYLLAALLLFAVTTVLGFVGKLSLLWVLVSLLPVAIASTLVFGHALYCRQPEPYEIEDATKCTLYGFGQLPTDCRDHLMSALCAFERELKSGKFDGTKKQLYRTLAECDVVLLRRLPFFCELCAFFLHVRL